MGYSDESLKLIKENNDANIISYHDHWQINLKREIISLYASQRYQEYSERINFFSNRPFYLQIIQFGVYSLLQEYSCN